MVAGQWLISISGAPFGPWNLLFIGVGAVLFVMGLVLGALKS